MQTIALTHQPVELFKLLKFAGLAASGGEAKMMIAEGLVLLNGEIETRKRKKVIAGDVVSLDGESFELKME